MKKISSIIGAIAIFAGGLTASANPSDMVITPSNANPVPSVPQEIVVTFSNAYSMSWGDGLEFYDYTVPSVDIYMTGPDNISETITIKKEDLGPWGTDECWGFKIHLSKEYSTPGDYKFEVPDQTFYPWDYKDAMTFTYRVQTGAVVDPDEPTIGLPNGVYISPAADKDYEAGSLGGDFIFSFSNFQIYSETGVEGNFLTVKDPNGASKTYNVKSAKQSVPVEDGFEEYPNPRALLFTVPAADLSTPGVYTFTMDLGSVPTYPEGNNKKYIWQYTVKAATPVVPAAKFTANPVAGAELEKFPTSIKVTYTGESTVFPNSAYNPIAVVTNEAGSEWKFNVSNMEYANTVTITVPDGTITEPGEYNVYIPGQYMGNAMGANPGDVNFKYTLKGSTVEKADANVTVTPAPGKISEFPSEISVVFNDESVIFTNPDLNPMVTISGPNGYEQKYNVTPATFDKIIKIQNIAAVTTEGEYTVTINVAGLTNPGGQSLDNFYNNVVFKYTLDSSTSGKKDANVTITPAPGNITEFPNEIKVTFVDEANVFTKVDLNPMVTISGPDGYEKKYNAVNYDFKNIITIDQIEAITTPGEYTVTINVAGLENMTENLANLYNNVVFSYTLEDNTPIEKKDANVTVTPAPGEVTEFPTSIRVTFDDESTLFPITDRNPIVTISGPDGYEQKCNALNNEYANTITVSGIQAITASGEYTVTISMAGIVNESGDNLDDIYNDVVFKYTLKGGETPTPPITEGYVVTPDPSKAVSKIPAEITVTFPDYYAILPNDGKVEATLKMTCAAHDIDKEFFSNDFVDKKGFKFTVDQDYTLPGVYKFSVDFSKYIGSSDNQMTTTTPLGLVEFEYVVGGVTTSIAPAPGIVDKIEEITITVTNAEKVELAEDAAITLKNNKNEELPIEVAVAGNVITVTANPAITDAGDYTLTIPANTISADGFVYDKNIYVDYTIRASAIEAIFVNGESADIYGIDGTVRIRKATIEDVRTLDKGIYIVNGQKVLVK